MSTENKLKVNQTLISGKIDYVGMFNEKHQSRVKLPAADTYSMPSVVIVSSKNRLGNVGEMLENVLCNVCGVPNDYTNRNNEQVNTANMWLEQV